MNVYQIQFADHKAISSVQVGAIGNTSVGIEKIEGKKVLKWITLFANNNEDSITIATRMANDFFSFLCQ